MTSADDLLDRVRQLAADLFDEPLERLTADTSPDDVEAWDSLQHLNLMLALEETFGVSLSPEDGDRMKTIGAAAALVAGRL